MRQLVCQSGSCDLTREVHFVANRATVIAMHCDATALEANGTSKKQKKKTHEMNMAAARAEAAKKMSEGVSAAGNGNKKSGGKEDDWLSGTAFTNPRSFSTGATKAKNRKGGNKGKK